MTTIHYKNARMQNMPNDYELEVKWMTLVINLVIRSVIVKKNYHINIKYHLTLDTIFSLGIYSRYLLLLLVIRVESLPMK